MRACTCHPTRGVPEARRWAYTDAPFGLSSSERPVLVLAPQRASLMIGSSTTMAVDRRCRLDLGRRRYRVATY